MAKLNARHFAAWALGKVGKHQQSQRRKTRNGVYNSKVSGGEEQADLDRSWEGNLSCSVLQWRWRGRIRLKKQVELYYIKDLEWMDQKLALGVSRCFQAESKATYELVSKKIHLGKTW